MAVPVRAGEARRLPKVAGKFDVAPLPGLNGPGVSTLGGHNLAISAFAKNKATALDFIKFFTSEDTQRANLSGHLAGADRTRSLYDDPALVKQYPYLPVLKESILNAEAAPAGGQYGDVDRGDPGGGLRGAER